MLLTTITYTYIGENRVCVTECTDNRFRGHRGYIQWTRIVNQSFVITGDLPEEICTGGGANG